MRQLMMEVGTGQSLPLDFFLPKELPFQAASDANVLTQKDSSVNVSAPESIVDVDLHSVENSEIISLDMKATLDTALQNLRSKILARIDNDPVGYEKSIKNFLKSVDRLPLKSDAVLQKHLHSFGKITSAVTQYSDKSAF